MEDLSNLLGLTYTLGGELAKSSEVCSLLVSKHQCGIQTTAGYSSWLNGKVERHIRTSRNTIRAGLFDSNLPNNLWCFRMEDSTEKFNVIRHSSHGQSPHFVWYKEKRHISEIRVWGCAIEAKLQPKTTKALDYRTESGYYLGTAGTLDIGTQRIQMKLVIAQQHAFMNKEQSYLMENFLLVPNYLKA